MSGEAWIAEDCGFPDYLDGIKSQFTISRVGGGPVAYAFDADQSRLIAAAPDFFSSAKSLIEAWDARTTGAQQIVTGKSDADLQKQAMAAIEGLRAAITKAVQS